MKLLAAPRASDVVQTMGECGFLEPILGGLGYPETPQPPHRDRGRARSPRPTRSCVSPRLASRSRKTRNGCAIGCGSPTPNPTGCIRGRGADRPARDRRAALVRRPHARSCSAPGARRRATRSRWLRPNPERPADAAFAAADRFLADAPEPKLPFSGADLIARGVAAGRPVGRALRAFQALWIRAGFPREPETLTRLLEEAVVASTRGEGS